MRNYRDHWVFPIHIFSLNPAELKLHEAYKVFSVAIKIVFFLVRYNFVCWKNAIKPLCRTMENIMDFSFLLNLLNSPKDPNRKNSNVLIASTCINHRRPNFFGRPWFWATTRSGELCEHEFLNLVTFHKQVHTVCKWLGFRTKSTNKVSKLHFVQMAPPEVVNSRIKCRRGKKLTRRCVKQPRELESRMPFVSMTKDVDCQKCVQFCFGCRDNTSHNNICSSVRHLKKENGLENIHKYYLPLNICVIYNVVVDVTISISHGKYPKSHRGPYHNWILQEWHVFHHC